MAKRIAKTYPLTRLEASHHMCSNRRCSRRPDYRYRGRYWCKWHIYEAYEKELTSG